MKKISAFAATTMVLGACATSPGSSPSSAPPPSPPVVGIANPASVFCIQQGGKLRMVKTPQGEHAMCVLADGREVEEWAYFRQHHPAKP